MRWENKAFVIDTDPSLLDFGAIHAFLARSYWASGTSRESLELAARNSICFGLYAGRDQIGFARAVSDRVRISHLADVYLLETYRGRGLARWLMECVFAYPEFQATTWFLKTRDAHGLYRKFGFTDLDDPSRYLYKLRPV